MGCDIPDPGLMYNHECYDCRYQWWASDTEEDDIRSLHIAEGIIKKLVREIISSLVSSKINQVVFLHLKLRSRF